MQELERRKKEENEYKQRALLDFEEALGMPQEDHTEDHVVTARMLEALSKVTADDVIMQYLDHLSLPDGMSFYMEESVLYGRSFYTLNVRTPDGTCDFHIWDFIHVETSADGVWEAYLLSRNILRHDYRDQHIFLYSTEDVDKIFLIEENLCRQLALLHSNDPDLENEYWDMVHLRGSIIETVRPLVSAPEVLKGKDRFYVRCCYWTNFGGVIQETTEVFISPDGKASFKVIEQKVLYEYRCNLMID